MKKDESQKVVLVIDRRENTRSYTKRVLLEAGMEVHSMFFLYDATEIAKEVSRIKPQVILMKITEIDEELRTYENLKTMGVFKDIKVLFTSLHTTPFILATCIPFLEMPYLPEALIDFINKETEKK